ncbi:hypothetical protein Tco_0338654, partial [Tanacetum coccineum]
DAYRSTLRFDQPAQVMVVTPNTYYQAPKTHKPYAPSSRPTPPTISHAPTRNIGKEIAKAITLASESASEEDEDSDPEQAQRDKDMQKKLGTHCKIHQKHL